MELNEKELEKILGGANPAVINNESLKNDELNEHELEDVHAGIYKQDLAEEMANQNASLYRKKMIDMLNEEKERIQSENAKSK